MLRGGPSLYSATGCLQGDPLALRRHITVTVLFSAKDNTLPSKTGQRLLRTRACHARGLNPQIRSSRSTPPSRSINKRFIRNSKKGNNMSRFFLQFPCEIIVRNFEYGLENIQLSLLNFPLFWRSPLLFFPFSVHSPRPFQNDIWDLLDASFWQL